MDLITEIIRKHLILEKKIAQIATKIDVTFNFEFHKGSHADSRETRSDQGENYNQRVIDNTELKYFIDNFVKRKIAENIIDGEIKDGVPFVVKSVKWELAFPLYPKHIGGTYWRMDIGTLWRESENNPFYVGKNQLVIWVN
jgi:hypothetical protein